MIEIKNKAGNVIWQNKSIDTSRGADLRGAKGVTSFGPIGNARRICYAYINNGVQTRLGCFNGDHNEAIDAIREKYGAHSTYELMLRAAVWSLASQEAAR